MLRREDDGRTNLGVGDGDDGDDDREAASRTVAGTAALRTARTNRPASSHPP